MSQKIFLTSALAMGFVAPAFAEMTDSNTFPNASQGEYMQENTRYIGAATSTNMDGVYSGTVNAVAEYDIIDYIVNAGQYLPADSETVITCPAGSFCPGIDGNVQYNQSTPQGIQTCPTGYASSAAGASSDTQCYRTCDINNMGTSFTNIAHATAVSGNDYYGSGTDTCSATGCENGWHITSDTLFDIIGWKAAINSVYIDDTGVFDEQGGSNGQSYYGLTENNSWAVEYDDNKGIVIGKAGCSNRSASGWIGSWVLKSDDFVDNLAEEPGASYCYCKVIGYKDSDGVIQNVSSPWAYRSSLMNCDSTCARICSGNFASNTYTFDGNDRRYKGAVLDKVPFGPATCEANTITINWNDVDPEYAGQNNENTAVYGEDVRTPVKAATKKGQTFRGWRFSKPEQTNLPE